jgi:hypothetical protein
VKCLDCRGDLTFGKTQKDDQTVFLRRRENGEFDWKALDKAER